MISLAPSQLKVCALALAILGTLASVAFTMEASMKSQKNSPSGVLYFSNGADIIRYSFKDRQKKALLSDRHSFFLFPNYSYLRKKIFFLEGVLTEGYYLSIADADGSNIQRIKKLSRICNSLSG